MEIPTILNSILFYCFYLLVFFCSSFHFCHASDTILPGQSLTREQTLISPGEKFVLGFFTPGKSQNFYIGIWFNKILPLTVVWVANRKNPITDSSIGVLQFTNNGNLVVLSNTTILWSTDVSVPARSAKLLDSGNLVLLDGNNSGTFLWQSFDYPTDTYIPGMKLGRNLKTNLNWSLTSWRTSDDPSPGNFTLELDIRGLPLFLILKGNDIYWSSGLWDGQGWSGVLKKDGEYIKDHNFISNSDEVYYIDSLYNRSVIYRVFLDKTGVLQQATWNEAGQVWMLFWSGPRSPCQLYGACGPFGVCNADVLQFCRCLSGFVPKHQRDWEMNKWSGGCVRETALKCGKEDGLLRLSGFKLPDMATNAQVDGSLSLNECREKCLNSCSCTAYASSDVQGGGSGCVIWSGDLIDLQNASQGHQEFYLRLSASELGQYGFFMDK